MTNNMNNQLSDDNKNFKTGDFYIAIVLTTLGFNLETLENENSSKVIFVFQNSPKLQETIKKYFSNRLKVNPQLLFVSQKTLKTYLH